MEGQWMRVLRPARSGGRVARVTEREDRAIAKVFHLLWREHLGHEAHRAMHPHVGAVRDGDARGLLAAMLQREETEVREVRDIHTVLRADPKNSAHSLKSRPLPKLDGSPKAGAGTGLRTRSSLRLRGREARSRRDSC